MRDDGDMQQPRIIFARPQEPYLPPVVYPKMREHINTMITKNYPLFDLFNQLGGPGSAFELRIHLCKLSWDSEEVRFGKFKTREFVDSWEWEDEEPRAILNVPQDAELSEINRAYRLLSKTCHPDCPTPDAEMFKRITEAYEKIVDRKQEHEQPTQKIKLKPMTPEEKEEFLKNIENMIMKRVFQTFCDYKPMHTYLMRRKKEANMLLNLDLKVSWDKTTSLEITKFEAAPSF